ncbi:MAG TPA: hypothetical protein DDW49_09005 [Deltaproteobacteria bacterium]|nr:MAG: hypothetical protein A2048_01000 [Deltaproteobacteria bacterium GWA2_45_12]HBF13498.1 hypothetical protein [Deltaproteobacteria bacterium]
MKSSLSSLFSPFIIFISLLTACAEAVVPTPPPAPPTLNISGEAVSDYTLSFVAPDFNGEAPYYKHTETIVLRNIGEEILTINNITMDDFSGAKCEFSFNPDVNDADSVTRCSNPPIDMGLPQHLEAGQSIAFDVTYTQDNFGNFSTSIVIESNDPDFPTQTINVTSENSGLGQAESPLRAEEPAPRQAHPRMVLNHHQLDFGHVLVGNQINQLVCIFNRGEAPLNILGIRFLPEGEGANNQYEFLHVHWIPSVIPAPQGWGSGRCPIDIQYHPNVVGNHNTAIEIVSDDPINPLLRLPILGTGVRDNPQPPQPAPQMYVYPRQVSFGKIGVGWTRTIEITIRNQDAGVLSIQEISLAPAGEGINEQYELINTPDACRNLEEDSSVRFSIRYRPQIVGEHNTSLTIVSNDPLGQNFTIPVTGNADIWPEISVNTQRINFGHVTPGNASDPYTIRIRSDGPGPLTLQNIILTAEAPAPNNNQYQLDNIPLEWPLILAPRTELELNLTYLPQVYGSHNTFLVISSDDENESTIRIPISGSANAREISVSTDQIDFGEVNQGANSPIQNITVQNEGNLPLILQNISLAPAADPINNQYTIHNIPAAWPVVLPAHGQLIFGLSYDPVIVGEHVTSISISSNDIDEPIINIPVTGTSRIQTGPSKEDQENDEPSKKPPPEKTKPPKTTYPPTNKEKSNG